jgi:hypothetical protein
VFNTAGQCAEHRIPDGRVEAQKTTSMPPFLGASGYLVTLVKLLSGGLLARSVLEQSTFHGYHHIALNNGRIVEEVGLDDGVTALRQLGLPFNAVVEGETAESICAKYC